MISIVFLLSFRLSGRRAASPDSIRSSRSPSPPGSSASGRTSPGMTDGGRGSTVGRCIGKCCFFVRSTEILHVIVDAYLVKVT